MKITDFIENIIPFKKNINVIIRIFQEFSILNVDWC